MKPNLNKSPHKTFATYFDNPELEPFLFALSKRMAEGHVCLDLKSIPEDEEFWEEYGKAELGVLSKDKHSELIGDADENRDKPFVLDKNRLYINRNYFYETVIVNKIKNLTESSKDNLENRKNELSEATVKSFIQDNLRSIDKDLKNFSEDEKPDWQLLAALQGFLNDFTIITGGPGTGKTTTVAKVLALLNKVHPGLKIALTAPTGKAAIRMKESLITTASDERNAGFGIKELVGNLKSTTIHRLLGSKHLSPFFKHNKANPLDFDVVIVDEASMIGVGLFAKLLSAIKGGARVVLLGDPDQLASVDSGSLFGDLCKSLGDNENKFSTEKLQFINDYVADDRSLGGAYTLTQKNNFLDEHLVRLKKTYRYDQKSKMGKFTKAVINGEVDSLVEIVNEPETSLDGHPKSSLAVDTEYQSKTLNDFILKAYQPYLEEPNNLAALTKLNNGRILAAVREGDEGIYALNKKAESVLKEKIKGFEPSLGFYHNQPIMVTKNNPNLRLNNGDVGIVRKNENGQLHAYFPNPEKSKEYPKDLIKVSPALLSDWETTFAMTIHKSQGSEFDEVLVVLPKKTNKILTRELLYTGVTRAKKKAVIQSTLEMLKETTAKKVDRVSGIQERIKL